MREACEAPDSSINERNQTPMKKRVHYIGLDVHKETLAVESALQIPLRSAVTALESQARFGLQGRTLSGSIESAWVFSRRVLRAAKRNQDGVRVLKQKGKKKLFPRRIFAS